MLAVGEGVLERTEVGLSLKIGMRGKRRGGKLLLACARMTLRNDS